MPIQTEVAWKLAAVLRGSVGVETDSIDNTLEAVETAGGKVVTPKHSLGGCGFMADFADPEGNVMTLWERPEK